MPSPEQLADLILEALAHEGFEVERDRIDKVVLAINRRVDVDTLPSPRDTIIKTLTEAT